MKAELFERLRGEISAERLVAVATVLSGAAAGAQMLLWPGGEREGSLGAEELETAVTAWARGCFPAFRSERRSFDLASGAVEVFLDVQVPPPQLVVVGAVHLAIPLVQLARLLGYRTAVVDPRGAFATPERFAHADVLLREWPDEAFASLPLHETTAVVFLSHDLKLDLPGLRRVLRAPVAYIGALGSKKTNAKRATALAEEGFSEAEITRIHAPIGLDLGGRSPEEIALAVLAEIVASRHGARLARVDGGGKR